MKGGKINDLSAVAKFQGEKQTKILEAHFLEGNPDQQICLNVNNIIKAKTSKTTADALFSAFGNILGDEAFSNEYLSALLNAANSISKAIDSIKESEIGKDFSEGHYEHLIEAKGPWRFSSPGPRFPWPRFASTALSLAISASKGR